MITIPGKIPISIYPTFWLFAALIGYLNSMTLVGTAMWVGIIFLSILFHEFGHALTAWVFGQRPRIELVALGGLTYHNGEKLSFWKQFFIILNGPLFGLLLYLIALLLLRIPVAEQGVLSSALLLIRAVNLFWTAVNLLPVLPLDGGQLMRIVMEKVFGLKGFKYALVISITVAVLISLFFFVYQAFIIGALFFLLAFQSYDIYRTSKNLSEPDRDESVKELLAEAEECIEQGKEKEAKEKLEKIRITARRGMIFSLATQYLAFLHYERGSVQEAYLLLLPLRKELGDEGLNLLHKAAFEQRDFSLVAELAGSCFQVAPNAQTALRNAYAHAELSQPIPAIGWLETAIQEGLENLEEILTGKSFDTIRQDELFQQLLITLKKQTDL